MPHIHCLPDEQIVEADRDETILHAVLYSGIPHTHACGGHARCSTCRVMVVEGIEHCSPPNTRELTIAQKLHFPQEMRLACQTRVSGNVTVRRLVNDTSEDKEIAESQVRLGSIGEEKTVAIMFADIRGFTKLSESMPPYDVIYVLNRYFHRVGETIAPFGGEIDNYMGDGFMALFGVDDGRYAAELAVRAGLAIIDMMEALNDELVVTCNSRLKIGLGIHYGTVVLGMVGASSNKRVTAIGDAVNFASRIESANKPAGTTLLVSETVYEIIRDKARVDSTHRVAIAGKTGEYTLYEIAGMTGEPPALRQGMPGRKGFFQKLLDLFTAKRTP